MKADSAKKRLAWFSAEHPADSFSRGAYLSDILLPEICNEYEVELFCPSAGAVLGGLRSKNFLTASLINKSEPFDFFLYNFENKPFCNFIRIHLGLKPGITWFHEFNLLDDGPEPILNSPWSRMTELFHNRKSVELWPGVKDQFIPSRPAALRETGLSLFSVFSNERDLAQYSSLSGHRLNPADRGVFLPLPLGSEVFRSEPMFSADNVLALCSNPTVDTHIHSLLMALKSNPQIKLRWLIESKDRTKCQELLSEFSVKQAELVEGKSVDAWIKMLKGSRFAVHFLYSFYDQLQPWLGCSLAQGKHCLLLNFGEAEHISDPAVIKIDCGSAEVPELALLLTSLSKTGVQPNELAIGLAQEKYDAKTVAAEFLLYLRQIEPQYAALNKDWERLEACGKLQVVNNSICDVLDYQKPYFLEIYQQLGFCPAEYSIHHAETE